MTQVLLLLSSPRGDLSQSTRVASALAEKFELEAGATLKVRDLADDNLPHVDTAYTTGRFLPPDQRDSAQIAAVTRAESLVNELLAADVLVIGASMINFAPSSTLKAWIDHIVWPGRTMIPTKDGPQGLITGKKAYIVAASGGTYSSGLMAPADHLVPYLKLVLGFVGITDIETIRIEAQTAGSEEAKLGVADAFAQVETIGLPPPIGALA